MEPEGPDTPGGVLADLGLYRALHQMALDLAGVFDPVRLSDVVRTHLRAVVGVESVDVLLTDAPPTDLGGLPLMVGGRCIGVLMVGAGANRLGQRELSLVAEAVAPAVAAARAYAQLRRERGALRDDFLRTLVHDIKAPLTSLNWHVQVLTRHAQEGQLEPRSLDAGLREIRAGAAEVMLAIDELHDLTRLRTGGALVLERDRIDLVGFVTRIVSARREWSRRDVRVSASETSLLVDVDTARLARVVGNLLDNADKYSAPEGLIALEIGRETCDGAVWAYLRVCDNGVGIPAGDLPRIFELYHRGDNVQGYPGEGLGLASVRQLVELHGGHIDVQSEEGMGSTFTVRLPLRSDTV